MAKKIGYWSTTILLAIFMTSGGIVQIIQPEWNREPLEHLGYPMFFYAIIGTWKVLGSLVLLLPRLPLVKEWAYAGLFFTMSGAFITHVAVGDPVVQMISPLVFIAFIITSWYLRPASRKIQTSPASPS